MPEDRRSRGDYIRLPEAEALLKDPELADNAAAQVHQKQDPGRNASAAAAPAPHSFEVAAAAAPSVAVRVLVDCCTLALSAAYALFSFCGIMSVMMTDSPDTNTVTIYLVTVFTAYFVLGGWAAAAFCCVYAFMAGPRRPWYMKYTLNMAPVLVHFLGLFVFFFLISASQAIIGPGI